MKNLYDVVTENDKKIKNLSESEKALFDKYKSVDELKIEVKEQIANELKNTDVKIMDAKEVIKNIIGEQKTNFESKDEHSNYIFIQLDKSEKDLFIKLAKKNNEALENTFASPGYTSHTKSQSYEESKNILPIESVNTVEALYDKHIHNGLDKAPKDKIHMHDIKELNSKQTKDKSKELTKTPNKFSMESVQKINNEIKEAEKLNPTKTKKQEISR